MTENERGATTVFVVANSAVARAGLTALVERDERFVVTGSAAEISALLEDDSLTTQTADVLLLDLERQTENLFDILLQFSSFAPDDADGLPAIIALVPELSNGDWTAQALRRGVRGILSRDASSDEIMAAIEAAAARLVVFPSEAVEAILLTANERHLRANIENDLSIQDTETLTPREREVLEMLAEGASNKSIAYRLGISEHTVKFHVSSIFGKLNASTRTEAVTEGLRRGLVLL